MCQQTKYQLFKSQQVLQRVRAFFFLAVVSGSLGLAPFGYPVNAQTRITIQPDGTLVPQQVAEPTDAGATPAKPEAGADMNGGGRAAPPVPVVSPKPTLAIEPVKLQSLTLRDDTPAAIAVGYARDALNKKAWAQLSTLVGPSQTDILGIYPASVSYTHLTLPTIYSV